MKAKLNTIIKNFWNDKHIEMTVLGINLLLMVIFWGGLAHNQYNADTLFYRYQDTHAAIKFRLEEGRYLVAFLFYLLPKLGINVAFHISITTFIYIILFSIALTINYFVLIKNDTIDYFALFCIDLVFLNVFFAELLMFAEAFFGIAYFLASLAFYFWYKKKHVVFLIFAAAAVCVYQYTAIYISILILFAVGIHNEFKLDKKTFGQSFVGVFVCLLMGALNILSSKILVMQGVLSAVEVKEEHRMGVVLKEKLSAVAHDTLDIYRNCKGLLIGKWLYLLILLLTLITIMVILWREQDWNRIGYFSLLLVSTFLLKILIPFIKNNYDNPPRFVFSFYLTQGLFILSLYLLIEKNILSAFSDRSGCLLKKCLCGVVFVYMLIQLICAQSIVNNRYASKAMDQVYTQLVWQKIQKYEETTGEQITKFAWTVDECSRNAYDEIGYSVDSVNERVIGKATWAILVDVSGRNFEHAEMDENIFDEYFKGKDWNEFNIDEQVIILDDTAYWCVY